MNLNEYPQAMAKPAAGIAKLQTQTTNFDLAIDQTQTVLKQIESEIDSAMPAALAVPSHLTRP